MKKIRYFLAALACLISLQAAAHWQWLDKDRRKVFSDRPPPSDIPEKDILERPSVKLTPALPPTAASSPRLSGIDKELTEKKKKAEDAEVARRKAEDERISKVKAENCVRAKGAKASIDSGRRIARANEKGEPEILDGSARVAEASRLQSIIDTDCN